MSLIEYLLNIKEEKKVNPIEDSFLEECDEFCLDEDEIEDCKALGLTPEEYREDDFGSSDE